MNAPGASERFLFYEGRTTEQSALVVEPGDQGPNHLILRNRSDHDVHDVVFVRDGRAWTAPRIPAGKTAGFVLVDPFDAPAAKAWLTKRWVDDAPMPTVDFSDCAMMRDPAVPVEKASGHRLYSAELDLLWGAWQGALLSGEDQIVYREDPAALDQVMPLALYSDMFHVPEVRRLGVVIAR